MNDNLVDAVREICRNVGNDRLRMIDVVREVQGRFGCVSSEAMDLIAKEIKCHRVEVEGVVSFYAFLSHKPKGRVIIRLCNDVVDKMKGVDAIVPILEREMGIQMGETSRDGRFTLEWAPCIGLSDQAPAAMVNEVMVTNLTPTTARTMVRELRQHMDPGRLSLPLGDGNNGIALVHSTVQNNIRYPGKVHFTEVRPGAALNKALRMSPEDVIEEIKDSRLRGRGGAGFPAGMKLELTRGAPGEERFVICNADEGEPGTFKDRVLLTERPDLVFEGMTIAGYSIGSSTGIVYLRAEYAYLRPYLESVLNTRRSQGLLGNAICGSDFDFDIRIQMGAGAYICGEETALIQSCLGERGDPMHRPPFPTTAGYRAKPTMVNNVETFSCMTRILENGAEWFSAIGTNDSSGTKLLSLSGDCEKPGVYEFPFGVTIREVLLRCGAEGTQAVLMGGPSGQMISRKEFDRRVCFGDLPTGGAFVVFGPKRDIIQIAAEYLDFFIHESCGYCTPCRVGNVLMRNRLEKILRGEGEPTDLVRLKELGKTVKTMSRCGLGQTSPNPVLSTLKNFASEYQTRVREVGDGMHPSFHIHAALGQATAIAGRTSDHFGFKGGHGHE